MRVVYRPFPTSNHNKGERKVIRELVVYRPFPTSNHNQQKNWSLKQKLYIVRFLHQTTTYFTTLTARQSCISSVSYIKPQQYIAFRLSVSRCISSVSYIKPQQALVVIHLLYSCISSVSYIKPQHKPTVCGTFCRCISSVSYIKPQHTKAYIRYLVVVYRPFPTSNHNRSEY